MNKFLLLALLLPLLSFANPNIKVDEHFFNTLNEYNSRIDTGLLNAAKQGDIQARLELARVLYSSHNEKGVLRGEALLKALAKSNKIARLHLAHQYLEGTEIVSMAEGKPKVILRNYPAAIEWFQAYLADPIRDNDALYLMAFSGMGNALIKNKHYTSAFIFYTNNVEMVKAEPNGLAAHELATLYHEGKGTAQDLEQAYYWYDIAAQKGLNIAIMERNFLKIELGI
ncbi:MAG: hypothetical protein MI754_03520 [Chromatiales bacterium]|nr:hypothetical protein [Chromatiales bacterium]